MGLLTIFKQACGHIFLCFHKSHGQIYVSGKFSIAKGFSKLRKAFQGPQMLFHASLKTSVFSVIVHSMRTATSGTCVIEYTWQTLAGNNK